VIVSVVLSSVAILLRYQLVGIYAGDQTAVAAGATRLLITGTLYFMNGLMNMMTGVIRGHGYSVLPTVLTLIGACALRILWVYTVFSLNPTLTILYISYPVSWTITSAALFISYLSIRRKTFRQESPEIPDMSCKT
jgi:Na+-driven multidrug efflux pump